MLYGARVTDGRISVLVVARVRPYRDALASILRADPGFDVVGALPRAPADLIGLDADVVVCDASGADALAMVSALLAAAPGVRILLVSVPDEDAELLPFAEVGVAGYVTCDQSFEDVIAAIGVVMRGELPCTPRIAGALARHVAALARQVRAPVLADAALLTPREAEILLLIDRGMSNKQIAGMLHIELATVKNHVHNILHKLGVRRRGEAAARLRARV